MQLQPGTALKGGEYIIRQPLGQGGFGITYLGEQTSLGRKVAIKEFFMKELCNRDEATSHVSVGSEGSREMVTKFREKFVKEARNIASLEHPHIVSVIDVFEENGTAYYVMKYCDGGSLAQLVKAKYPTGMPEGMALKYIREVASALDYIHKRSINHLDVKPANIMLNESGNAVLIDFGLSKQYDAETGQQTSSTPVGISEGYAPMEQYKKGGVGQFSPSTDIYSLGATLYKLITGQTPPDASTVNEEGLPPFQASAHVKAAITVAMQSRRADRPQSVAAFLSLMDGDTEETHVDPIPEPQLKPAPQPTPKPQPRPVPTPTPAPTPAKSKSVVYGIIAAAVILLGIVLLWGNGGGEDPVSTEDVVEVVEAEDVVVEEEPVAPLPVQPEATGYDVEFTCNVSTAMLYIDGKASGSASETHFLKTGTHTIKVTAEGYKDYTSKITVNSQTKPYRIKMTEAPKPVVEETPAPVKEVPAAPAPIASATTGSHRGHDWVDLGLPSGTKWATMNVGANSPSDYGNYYAWGETGTKDSYTPYNYKFCINPPHQDEFSKYVTDRKYGSVDGKQELDLSDDAAYANWGLGWRMPSEVQQEELRKECKWEWTTFGGHKGFNVVGPNGNSIFLPAAGYGSWELDHVGSHGGYVSRSLCLELQSYAYSINFYYGGFVASNGSGRIYGHSIRPVLGS